MTRRVVRAVLAAASALVAVVLVPGAAVADTGAGLSNVKRGADGTVTGVLTVSAGTDTAVVDEETPCASTSRARSTRSRCRAGRP